MSTIRNMVSLDAYSFDTVGNRFLRKETVSLPLPFLSVVGCAPGPDGLMKVYSKITVGNPPTDYYVGQTIAQLDSLIVQ